MARIRSTHPDQWMDEQFVQCSFAARLLAIAIRNHADDNGIFEWKPVTIKMKVFPADNVDVAVLLQELSDTLQIHAYEAKGRQYGIIRNFTRFQRPKKPSFLFPPPAVLQPGYILHEDYAPRGSESDTAIRREDSPPVTNQFPTGTEPVTETQSSLEVGEKRSKKEKNTKKEKSNSDFAELWNLFPAQRKGNREKAEAAYRQSLTRDTHDAILAGLKSYTDSEEVRQGFAKGMAAWLNDDRWTCDYRQSGVASSASTTAPNPHREVA